MREIIEYKKGEVIFKEGALESFMYDIKYGTVGIYIDYRKPTEQKIAEITEDIFGEMAVIDAMPRSATAVALERTGVVKIEGDEVFDFFVSKPEKILDIMQALTARIRDINDEYMKACRSIDEYLHCEKNNRPKSNSLIEAMQGFSEVAQRAKKFY